MRILGHLVLVSALAFTIVNFRDEARGITFVESPVVTPSATLPTRQSIAHDPKGFRNAMNYHWVFAGSLWAVGFFTLRAKRRIEALDPFSPDYTPPHSG